MFKNRIKALIQSKKGEGDYIELCVCLVCILLVVALSINIYSFYTLKDEMNEVAESIVEYAATTGKLDADFDLMVQQEKQIHSNMNFSVSTAGTKFWNTSKGLVNRGDVVVVTVTTTHALRGLGIINNINIPCSVVRRATCTGSDLSATIQQEDVIIDEGP